ncbi:zinc finger protein RFP-like [Hemicordylus capensis]|uniref:zinc finger protein RFP-like n=1 Tax=Hemicordylus capensis TaxID=884348 RepID=UPI002303CD3C|nr:zinc finger protein RFP-like [Hemicordylus capensis]XP_053143804.1 zinc finger protein RFP-like [Hemicordylus capensis]
MAALNPEKSLQDEATCSICLDYFQSPVMIIDCGHNFCRDCIGQCCEGSVTKVLSCPQCRKPFLWKNIRPNRHLWNIVELAKQFSARRANEAGDQRLCEKHQEPLKLFCEQDRTPICVVCDRSKVHKNHNIIPIEEAAQAYQDKIHNCLQTLKEEREKILSLKSEVEKPSQDLLKEAKAERQKLVAAFQELRELLEKEEHLLLAQLKNLETEIEKKKEENASRYSEEISLLGSLIGELEQKRQEPPSGLLQDIGGILKRCKKDKFQPPVLDSSEFKRKLKEFSQKSASLQGDLKKFRETLIEPKWIKENVLLDPLTAHPRFVVSDNQKSVAWGSFRMDLPYNAKRFDPARCVLGSQGFSSGKHHWTVDVANGTFWAVGVARESVTRKGQLSFIPEEGIWAVGFYNGQYKALTSPPTFLNPRKQLKKIQICLDYEEETVTFCDAEGGGRLVKFKPAHFAGKKIFPFFRVGDINTCIGLC